VTFAIGRIDDVDETLEGEIHESAELLEAASGAGDVVIALDGATIDQQTATAIAEAAAVPVAPGAMAPSTIERADPD
jgi:ethanolamine utilization protein EutQ (cupin superfamily)